MIPSDLPTLAEAVAKWADDLPCVWRVYLYGSRVRGDARPNSDVDVFVQSPQAGMTSECLRWWLMPPEECFGPLWTALQPLDLHLGYLMDDPAREWVQSAAWDPARIVLQVRKVVCLWTPPKSDRSMRPAPTLSLPR